MKNQSSKSAKVLARSVFSRLAGVASILLMLALAFNFSAMASTLTLTFTNQVGQPDTNIVRTIALDNNTPVLANGTVLTKGLPVKWTPDSNGVVNFYLTTGNYMITNAYLGSGMIYCFPDSTTNATAYAKSGFNTFVTSVQIVNTNIPSLSTNTLTAQQAATNGATATDGQVLTKSGSNLVFSTISGGSSTNGAVPVSTGYGLTNSVNSGTNQVSLDTNVVELIQASAVVTNGQPFVRLYQPTFVQGIIVTNGGVVLQGVSGIVSQSGQLDIEPSGAMVLGDILGTYYCFYDPVSGLLDLGGGYINPSNVTNAPGFWAASPASGGGSSATMFMHHWNEAGAQLSPETPRYSGVFFGTANLQNTAVAENVQSYFTKSITLTNETYSWGCNGGNFQTNQSITIHIATNNPDTANMYNEPFTSTGFGVTIVGNGWTFIQTNTGTQSYTLPAGVSAIRIVTYHGTNNFTSSLTANGFSF